MKTQVCIIGGGPSGLLLSQLLHLQGIDTVVLERHSREYVLARIRAGVLEHGFAALMREAQCGERMDREGEIHEGFFIANQGQLQRVDLHKYSGGNSVVVYGQTELTRDLYEARDRMKGKVIHNAEDVQPHDLKSANALCHLPRRRRGRAHRLRLRDRRRRLPRRQPQVDPEERAEGIREGLSLRLAGRSFAHQAGVARADLCAPRARLCVVLAALAGAEPLLHPGAADATASRTGPTTPSGPS